MVGSARALRRRKRLKRLELRIMGIMAVNAEQILLVTIPTAGPLAMDAYLPVAELVTVALST